METFLLLEQAGIWTLTDAAGNQVGEALEDRDKAVAEALHYVSLAGGSLTISSYGDKFSKTVDALNKGVRTLE